MRVISLASAGLAMLLLAACGEPAPGTNGAGTPPEEPTPAAQARLIDATWNLDSAASRIGFASIKAGEIIEAHTFGDVSGMVSSDGAANIEIALDSVDTKIDIRNERMREMLFETETYPSALVSATIDLSAYEDLGIGARTTDALEATLSLHGIEATLDASIFVTRISETRVEVSSVEPVILYVEDFNLADGIEALRSVANLPAITPASPVSFTLVFEAA